MLDPYDPAANDSDILSEMMQNFESFDSLFKYTHRLGGRWIVVAKNGNEIRLFNDPAGLRQVFYSDVGLTGELWCASQPGMIADILSLDMSVEGIDYINSYEFQNNPEYHWPGTSTPFKEIIHLLPNHFLHLSTGMCERFWPNCFFQEMSLDTAIQKCSALFQGVIRSASNRFELALGVTAGLDCRVVLAASKGIKNIFSYMTVRQIGMRNDHADVMIPSVMLAQNDLRHDLVESSLVIDKEHFKIFQGNTAVPHSVYASDTYAINDYYAKKYGKRFVVLTGSAAEIGRCSHRSDLKKPLGERIYAEDLASLERMGKSRYVLDSFDKWLRGAENIYNYDVLDLHEWEQGHGNWLAMCQLEFDIAWKDLITPYNCRELLETMLSVDKKYRKAPDYLLYKAIIYNLWPELLNVPVNPHKDYAISRRKKSAGIRKYMGIIPSPIKKSLKNIQRLFL
ncbi:MAG: hypothetical protein IH588_03285 [Anaerolineales bacterium]|nr:hypothetical protein [Anaerolineales bacterium]